MPRILCLDGLSAEGVDVFRAAGFEVDVKPPQKTRGVGGDSWFV